MQVLSRLIPGGHSVSNALERSAHEGCDAFQRHGKREPCPPLLLPQVCQGASKTRPRDLKYGSGGEDMRRRASLISTRVTT